ncbi:hypothetical protein AVEN_167222-1 [Araneus ventricosus]|uniref:Uncharacterized protein n=1 Tax=Araneus ventricosus TaxID=182803 RepID=A0A4Y2JRR0_ARAVE|nr:hypothetical protein AVEN_167222-1 [Araneus ventricosus]
MIFIAVQIRQSAIFLKKTCHRTRRPKASLPDSLLGLESGSAENDCRASHVGLAAAEYIWDRSFTVPALEKFTINSKCFLVILTDFNISFENQHNKYHSFGYHKDCGYSI